MKIKIEIDESIDEDEIVIRCKNITDEIQQIQNNISEVSKSHQKIQLYHNETEYYLSLDDILFFETMDNRIIAHSTNDIYDSNYKLYELEEILPRYFVRISKSTIINTHEVLSIDRNLTASSLVSFKNTYKQVYVSRRYYKQFKYILDEKRIK